MRNESATATLWGKSDAHRSAGCEVRAIESRAGMELYITAEPGDGSIQDQAEQMYASIAKELRIARAHIVQERLFACADSMRTALRTRARICAQWNDDIAPTLLIAPSEENRILGAQVHAIHGINKPTVLRSGNTSFARAFECDGLHYLTASGLRAPHLTGGPLQTRETLRMAEGLLDQANGTLADLARTWIWMDDILSWYPQLNRERTQFFTERGLMGAVCRMPASTGIGVSPAGARVAIDLFAAWGREDAVARFNAIGNQRSAYEYGSAFARASRVKTPGGSTVFCSGTAAIDAQGKSCFPGDADGQIHMTLDNVHAVLRDMQCSTEDVVQAMAYCATPHIEEHFRAIYADRLPWPCLCVIGDVCRRDLLFEVEVQCLGRATNRVVVLVVGGA